MNQDQRDPAIAALSAGVELRNTEFKESQPFDVLRWKIIKTAMAMANLRDGGQIIIGAHQRNGPLELDGIHADCEATYDADDVLEAINKFANPPVTATVRVMLFDERRFVVIQVAPFERTPVICRRGTPDGVSDVMRRGDIFVRSRDRIATTRLVDDDLMAELVEVAAERRAAQIIGTAQRAGLRMPEHDAVAFAREREGFDPSA